MPTSPRRPAKKGGSVKNPKAAKVKRYEIKPLRWVEISEYCWFAKSIMGECRLWKTEKGRLYLNQRILHYHPQENNYERHQKNRV